MVRRGSRVRVPTSACRVSGATSMASAAREGESLLGAHIACAGTAYAADLRGGLVCIHAQSCALFVELELDLASRTYAECSADLQRDRYLSLLRHPHWVTLASDTPGFTFGRDDLASAQSPAGTRASTRVAAPDRAVGARRCARRQRVQTAAPRRSPIATPGTSRYADARAPRWRSTPGVPRLDRPPRRDPAPRAARRRQWRRRPCPRSPPSAPAFQDAHAPEHGGPAASRNRPSPGVPLPFPQPSCGTRSARR